LRSGRAAGPLGSEARAALGALEPGVPVYGARSLEAYLDERLEQPRLYAGLVGAFGGFSLLLALVGLGAGVGQALEQRRPEFGLRLALGARPVALLGLLLRQTGGPWLAALALGSVAALALGPVMAHLIVHARPVTAGECAATALGMALVAGLTVAASAAGLRRLDPARVLRAE